ncbi:hypothetical protein LWI29_021654 [Acer saccharum]|uniref:RNase H type-1 domain-containing protein n=1 Tax=Acer saccharum TaxID=4024 RepID=A0AA39T1F0_ACESA|nr:hypothetical protein LWI29_021654 [Acer saccharum]
MGMEVRIALLLLFGRGILLLAYKRANDDKRVTGVHVSSNVPLALSLYKINTDASLDSRKNRVGVGVIIRDPSGEVLGAFAQHWDACFVPSVAEALALLRALILLFIWDCCFR